jgi:hypothetical protein
VTNQTSDPEIPLDAMQHSLVGANPMRHPPTTDRDMWIAIRSALIGIVRAIETHANSSPLSTAIRASLLAIVDAIEKRYNIKKERHGRIR